MCVSSCAIRESSSAASRSRGDLVFFWAQPCCNSLDRWYKTTVFWNTEKNWKRWHRIEISNCSLRAAPPKNKKTSGFIDVSEVPWKLHLPVHLYCSRSYPPPFLVIHPPRRIRITRLRSAHQQLCPPAYLPWCLRS